MNRRVLLVDRLLLRQGRQNRFQSGGAMEHLQVLSATMVGPPGKFLNSRRSRMAKTVTFWPWWQRFNSFCFESLSFLPLFPFFLFATQKSGGRGSHAPLPAPQYCQPCYEWTNEYYEWPNEHYEWISEYYEWVNQYYAWSCIQVTRRLLW